MSEIAQSPRARRGAPAARRRSAFTLVELLIVVSIIALLLSILLPSLRKAREQAKEVLCRSHLSAFGKGFMTYAGSNRDYLCSGSFDPEKSNGRDGPVDEVGWVADLVNAKLAYPGKMLCPSNLAKYNQKLGEIAAGADSYTPDEARTLIERGYNTNYTQTWYMARGEWEQYKAMASSSPLNMKRLDTTRGPLRVSDMIRVSPSRVPLLGDGTTDPEDSLVLGGRSIKSMTDGPFGGPYGIQNFKDLGPSHGFSTQRNMFRGHMRERASILFADAHVEGFQDLDHTGDFRVNDQVFPMDQTDLRPSKVFDGVISLGRRSEDLYTAK